MKCKINLLTILQVIIILFFVSPGITLAKSPWAWQLSLKTNSNSKQLSMPFSLMIDPVKERYYVADAGNNRLVSFDKDGELLNAFNANNSLKVPADLIRQNNEVLKVIEKGRSSITEINLNTKTVTPHQLSFDGKTIYPDRIENDDSRLYILDKNSGAVLSFSPDLKPLIKYYDKDNDVHFVDFKIREGQVTALSHKEKNIYFFNDDGSILSKLSLDKSIIFPYSYAFGPAELIYVVDRFDSSIVVVDFQGKFKYKFLGMGHVRGRLYYPSEIKFDPWGRLCVVDEGNGRVEIYSME
ncbi:MAG: hypothetical protein KKE17_04415 [Proteobacteria bacterium]|nr:hypothetical protein [Pseudomonadota bacterium]MBU1709230.1 hypothetical protein [Pseudomonadota bacterium]